ncbi:MAG: hypothetical protein JJ899_17125, partial [Alphaproteobacteria bacterium]|nr:hypothetical protein [Alphaproteobacteria bacterium]
MEMRPTVRKDRLESLSRLQAQIDSDLRAELGQHEPDLTRIEMLKEQRAVVTARIA